MNQAREEDFHARDGGQRCGSRTQMHWTKKNNVKDSERPAWINSALWVQKGITIRKPEGNVDPSTHVVCAGKGNATLQALSEPSEEEDEFDWRVGECVKVGWSKRDAMGLEGEM